MKSESEVVTLVDEEGVEHHFILEKVVEHNGVRYALVTPQDSFIFRVETDADGDDILVDIEDDAEFDQVAVLFDEEDAEDEDAEDEDEE